ncbi:MAG: hypothetical protein ACRDL7_00110 [Gaiellaceae bacterium]
MDLTPEQEEKLEALAETMVNQEFLDRVSEELYGKDYQHLDRDQQDVADQGLDVLIEAFGDEDE